jgi:hypothetical protein
MRFLIQLLLVIVLPSMAMGDTLDWRDCTPHSKADTAAYREWLRPFFEDQAQADQLALSYEKGDMNWGDRPCEKADTKLNIRTPASAGQ